MQKSFLSWVDFDSKQKQKMSEVIRLFSEQGVRDELGFGTIRDVLADQLFPGTSTIQTRARYFVMIPYLFLDLEEKARGDARFRKNISAMDAFIDDSEVKIIQALRNQEDTSGTIGKRNEDLDRYSNEIYWAGLKRWGILKKDISRYEYLETISNRVDSEIHLTRLRKDGEDDYHEKPDQIWNSGIFELYEQFKNNRTISHTLTIDEAKFLRNQINETCPTSFMNAILKMNLVVKDLNDFWDLDKGQDFKDLFYHARNYSILAQGAVSAYYYFCSIESQELKDGYKGFFKEWYDIAKNSDFSKWGTKELLSYVLKLEPGLNIHKTKPFIEDFKLLFDESQSADELLSYPKLYKLMRSREESLKGQKRARLLEKNQKLREKWIGSHNKDVGAQPAGGVNYRWFRVKRIVSDIVEGASK